MLREMATILESMQLYLKDMNDRMQATTAISAVTIVQAPLKHRRSQGREYRHRINVCSVFLVIIWAQKNISKQSFAALQIGQVSGACSRAQR